jgi:hypothetical protein
MPNTYTKIDSVTVGSGGVASITFSSIPATYTDLVVKNSSRAASGTNDMKLTFNGSGSGYSDRSIYGSGTIGQSSTNSASNIFPGVINSNTTTANTFASNEYYIPNYTSSNFKTVSVDSLTENNATTAYSFLVAALWSNTSAITSITLAPNSGNFDQYSTFTLYGISNA